MASLSEQCATLKLVTFLTFFFACTYSMYHVPLVPPMKISLRIKYVHGELRNSTSDEHGGSAARYTPWLKSPSTSGSDLLINQAVLEEMSYL